jgi:TatD DNase family protein
MELIDTHTHLFLPEFENDQVPVIERAKSAGVGKLLLPNIDVSTINAMQNLCNIFPEYCFPMIGLHPTSVKQDYPEQLKRIETLLQKNQFIAIGETGMDLYWDKTFIREQRISFEIQIDWTRKYSLPLVIHCRESFAEIIEIIKNKHDGSLYSGVFHSFPGNPEQADEVISLGFKIGVNGIVTFKNSKLMEVVQKISLENILLETDSPYLTPVPMRGKRNESAYLVYIAQKIAEIKDIPLAEVARVTTLNAKKLFKLD